MLLVLVYVRSESGKLCIRALGNKAFYVYRLLGFYVESVLEFTSMTMGFLFLLFFVVFFFQLLTVVSSIRIALAMISCDCGDYWNDDGCVIDITKNRS